MLAKESWRGWGWYDFLLIYGDLGDSTEGWDILLVTVYAYLALCFLVLDLDLVAEIFWRYLRVIV